MNTRFRSLGAALLALITTPLLADGKVSVEFQNPDQYTDVKERQFKTPADKNAHLKNLKSWLEKRAAKQLSAGQQLQIVFLDIDLAGDFEPWQGPSFQDIRVIKDLYPPRAKLRFKLLAADGAVLREGERELRDLGYLSHGGVASRDALEHDERMLEDWLRKEFPASS